MKKITLFLMAFVVFAFAQSKNLALNGTTIASNENQLASNEATDPDVDGTLSDLKVNGITVDGFASSIFNYDVLLPIGTTVVPEVIATTSQTSSASAVVTDAISLPATTSVLVTAQNSTDTNTYTINFTVEITSVNQTFDLTFEAGTTGSVVSNWNVFENAPNAEFEVVSNPDPSGVNTSSTVAKVITTDTATNGSNPWAGCETQHGTIWEWVLDGATTTIRVDVYKSVISDVAIKMVNTTSGTVFQMTQPNTVTNAWETLTYDITAAVVSGDNHNVDQIVVLPDWRDRNGAGDTTNYFDNISWEGLKIGEAPLLGMVNFETTKINVYPNPTQNVWNIESSNQILNSVKVYDASGKQVVSLKPNSKSTGIEASHLNTGLYFVRLESSSGAKTIRLIKN